MHENKEIWDKIGEKKSAKNLGRQKKKSVKNKVGNKY